MKFRHLALLFLSTPLHAGQMIPAQIPASAKWQVHVDFEAMRDSKTGKAVFAHIETHHGAQMRAFKRMFSMHPLEDLRGLTLWGDGKPEHAVALIDGQFDRAHLEDIVQAADDYSSSTHAGFTVHTWDDQGKLQNAAFAEDGLLVFGRQIGLVKAALEAITTGLSATVNPFFSAGDNKPLVAASARLSEIEMPGDEARILRMADTLRLAADEHQGRFVLRAGVEAANPASADRLRRILDGILAFAQASDPKLDGLDLQAKFDGATDQGELTANVSLPVDEWVMLMEKVAAEEAAKKEQQGE